MEDYWILKRDEAQEKLLLTREQRVQARAKRLKDRSGLPGPWFDFVVIVLTVILGIICFSQGLL